MFGEPETNIGKFLGEIAFILGALTLTYTLNRISTRLLRTKLSSKMTAIISFVIGLILILFVSSFATGMMAGLATTIIIYLPCLILWLIIDIRWSNMLTLNEASEFLELDTSTLNNYAIERTIPAKKRGKEWRFYKSGILDWLRKRKTKQDEI